MTRSEKIKALADDIYASDCECMDCFKHGILAGIALRDEELLEMEFDEPYVDERGDEKYIAGYTEGARWQHEQMLKAIKGDG